MKLTSKVPLPGSTGKDHHLEIIKKIAVNFKARERLSTEKIEQKIRTRTFGQFCVRIDDVSLSYCFQNLQPAKALKFQFIQYHHLRVRLL